jgi:hypothetical protein
MRGHERTDGMAQGVSRRNRRPTAGRTSDARRCLAQARLRAVDLIGGERTQAAGAPED